jgi:hypothetical protein
MSWCGRAGEVPQERPSLICLIDPSLPESAAWKIGAGAEEEGVFLVFDRAGGTPEALSLAASRRSRLDVGIGASAAGVAAAVAKVVDRPYVALDRSDPDHLRWIGAVAACLAKGEPIPPLPSAPEAGPREEAHRPASGSIAEAEALSGAAPGDDSTGTPSEDPEPLPAAASEVSPLEDRYAGAPLADLQGEPRAKAPAEKHDDMARAIAARILESLHQLEQGR